MKIEEYQDYVKLLFNKYLKYVPLLILIGFSVGVYYHWVLQEKEFNLVIYIKMLAGEEKFSGDVELAVTAGIVSFISFYLIRFLLLYLPSLFGLLFGVAYKKTKDAYDFVHSDFQKVHDKHNLKEVENNK